MNKLYPKNKFWDIHDIISSNEKFTCIAEKEIYNVPELDKSLTQTSGTNTIKEGSKLELPLWLALPLHTSDNVSIQPPKYFNVKMNNSLHADPTIVNLKAKTNYFYDICLKLLPYLDEGKIWPKCLIITFAKRYFKIIMNSANVQYEDTNIKKNLCLKEKEFYDKMLTINKEIKFFLQNYRNNNKVLSEGLMVNAKRKKFK
jgi:hypothetical protein